MAGAGGQLREQGRDCVEGVHMLCLGQAVAERVIAHINDEGDRLAACLTGGSTRQGFTN